MKSACVVNLLYEVGKVFGHLFECFIGPTIDRFDLQSLHGAFGLGIVIGIPAAADRADQTIASQCIPVDVSCVLTRGRNDVCSPTVAADALSLSSMLQPLDARRCFD